MNNLTTKEKGNIYVRSHPAYDFYNACKLGKTNNIPDRDSQYATGEIVRGTFQSVYEVPNEQMDNIERSLQYKFRDLNLNQYDGGTEFYNKAIISRIEPYLIQSGISYKKLTEQEISHLVRCNRIKKTMDNVQKLKSNSFMPRNDQIAIIENSVDHFQQNDKGLLVLICGVGKTLISLWITQKLNSNTILIGVPNILLLKQWKQVICVLFKNVPHLTVSGKVEPDNIVHFLQKNQTRCIVITTYSSSHKVLKATQRTSCVFDMKILDEVHHLTKPYMEELAHSKKYIEILKISSMKQLSLTATLKQIEGEGEGVVSNDNIDIFGKIIDKKCLLWAIDENIVCDYVVQTIITDEEQLEQQLSGFNITEENDKRLFLSAFASLKSINDGHSHHCLIYSNNRDNSKKIIQYINMLLKDYFIISDLYSSEYHGNMNPKNQKEIINSFEKAKFGIIACVYCLGEGYDNHNIDAVVFAENMTSNIRIVQSALRACRKDKNDVHKISKIILPILNRGNWLENNENSDLKKVKEVIKQMGSEDETIIQKIKVLRIDIEKQKPKLMMKKDEKNITNVFGEYDDELTQKLRLKTTKRTILGITYEKARKIIADKKINSKESYYELCERDNRLTTEPEIDFKGQFTNWIDYLSIERVYYDFETCKKKVAEHLQSKPELKPHHLDLSTVSDRLREIDTSFPPNGLWTEYYNVKGLHEIITITNKKKRMGIKITN
jgi:predicted helicase